MPSRRTIVVRFILLAFIAMQAAKAAAQSLAPTSLTLTSDAVTAQVHQLIHLTAVVSGTAAPAGTITFFDNAAAIATAPVTQPATILGVASLAQGSHTLTAVYSGDGANAPSQSVAITVSMLGLPVPLGLSAASSPVYANSPVQLGALGLPSDASGAFTFTDAGQSLTTMVIAGVSVARYQAFGDAITAGSYLPDPAQRYPSQIATAYSLALDNFAIPGASVCDVLPLQILANNVGATQSSSPLTSVMIGSSDSLSAAALAGAPGFDATFRTCLHAALSWLAIPSEYKLPAAGRNSVQTSGIWSVDATGALINTAGSGSLTFQITAAGGNVYLWQMLSDSLPGSFTIVLDGIPGASYSTQPSPAIGASSGAALKTFGLIRVPVSAGPHAVSIVATSGTVGILGIATPPSPGGASVHQTVLATDVPRQLTSNPAIAQLTQDIQDGVSILQAEGLNVVFVSTQPTMTGSAEEMQDAIYPNALGQTHLFKALNAVLSSVSTAPFSTFVNTAPAATFTFANPGDHALAASYSGDAIYASSSATLHLNVLPQTATGLAFTTPVTHATAGSVVVFHATVTPASATGTVTIYDGTQLLAQIPLAQGAALFSTSSLDVGIHSLTAVYSGDAPDLGSASPPLAIEITPSPTTLDLAPVAATATYGPAATLYASITPASATGTLSFLDTFVAAGQSSPQVIALGQSALANGMASITGTLAIGTHSISASYNGDLANLATTSNIVSTSITAIATTTTLTPIAPTTPFGNAIALSAQVSPAGATGAVSFRDAAAGILGQSALVDGTATLSTDTLAVGSHQITALYSGDATHTPSASLTDNIEVVAARSAIVLAPIAPELPAGASLRLSASVTPASATGTVTFRDANTGTLGQGVVVRGTATIDLPSLTAGTYSITAIYSGDPVNAPSISSPAITEVTPATTSVSLFTQLVSANFSTPISVSATVTPSSAGGIVQFVDASGSIGFALLLNGVATTQLATLTTGVHVIHASYLGDALDASSSSPSTTIAITPDPTTTSLTLAQTAVAAGANVVFDVRVATGLAANPTGRVTIYSGTTLLGSAPLANANAGTAYATVSCGTSALGLGFFPVTASYAGDANDLASNSATTSFSVIPTPTLTTLSLSANQVSIQTSVLLAATVNSLATPSGAVVFSSNGKPFATVPLDAKGRAETVITPSIGVYSVSAEFAPAGLFAVSVAAPQTLTVTLPLSLSIAPAELSVTAASTHSATLVITPLSNFSGNIAAQCVSPAAYIHCTVDAPAAVGGLPSSAIVHITIPANTVAAAGLLPLFAIFLLPLAAGRHKIKRLTSLALLAVLTSATGCAVGGTFFDIPTGAQPIVLNVTAAGLTMSATMTVDITH